MLVTVASLPPGSAMSVTTPRATPVKAPVTRSTEPVEVLPTAPVFTPAPTESATACAEPVAENSDGVCAPTRGAEPVPFSGRTSGGTPSVPGPGSTSLHSRGLLVLATVGLLGVLSGQGGSHPNRHGSSSVRSQ